MTRDETIKTIENAPKDSVITLATNDLKDLADAYTFTRQNLAVLQSNEEPLDEKSPAEIRETEERTGRQSW